MDKEYVKVLTEDIEKAVTIEEKLNLIKVFVFELGTASSGTLDGVNEINDTLKLAAEADRGLVKAVNTLLERVESVEKYLHIAQEHIVSIAESANRTEDGIKRMLDRELQDAERFQKFSEMVFKRLDRI